MPATDQLTNGSKLASGVLSARSAFILIVLLGFFGLYLALDGLTFPVGPTDEEHFWPTSQRFAETWPPSAEDLRGYGELNTPLPFVIFGALEHYTGDGLRWGRFVNLVVTATILIAIARAACNSRASSGIRAAIGLACFPYFIGVGFHLYTDPLAVGFVLLGVVLHHRGRPISGAVAFTAAIACRQYMVAFPAALFVHEITRALAGRTGTRPPLRFTAIIAPAVAAATLLGWFWWFGGLAPATALAKQQLGADQPGRSFLQLYPAHALYFLACVGIYYVVVESILWRRWCGAKLGLSVGMEVSDNLLGSGWGSSARWGVVGGVAIIVTATAVWPPLGNENYPIPAMGYFDRALRLGLSDLGRAIVYGAFAIVAFLRFRGAGRAEWFVWINAGLMMKAHICWDKYAMALLAVLWWERSVRADDRRATTERGASSPATDRRPCPSSLSSPAS